MTATRRNVWELGSDWADPVLWYARGVKAMQARPLADPTGWRFYGAIHGMDPQLWQQLGQLSADDTMPAQSLAQTYWNQCQHGTWYFLPWHRGYLIAFESVVRDAVIKLGGPSDWALPYWNYFKPGQHRLPPAFATADWPDGQGDNPLFVAQRYGPNNDGTVVLPMEMLNLSALADRRFAGAGNGGSAGFGGVATGFSHGGQVHGGVETQPHDYVHGLVGGSDTASNLPGLMSDPDTAALDPIFWLHHANIDRLWEVWRRGESTHTDPQSSSWVNGAEGNGQRAFSLPLPDGSRWTYTPGQMSTLSALSYTYDDLASPAGTPRVTTRLQQLGASPAIATTISEASPMAHHDDVELLGASQGGADVTGTAAHFTVALDTSVRQKVSASLRALSGGAVGATREPDRIFLNLENLRGRNDATVFHVYIDRPASPGMAAAAYLAGSIALFGVRKATQPDGEHAGNGLTLVLEITHVIDALHAAGDFERRALHVRLVPVRPVAAADQVRIGRVSLFRQGH
jgi:tyrosinase